MVIIALDLGCDTGVAVGNDEGGLALSGVKKFKNTIGKRIFGSGDDRFSAFHDWLLDMIKDTVSDTKEPVMLVAEKTNKHMPGYDGLKLHFGLQAVIQMIQSEYSGVVEYRVVPAMTLKKYWLGSAKLRGKASKAAMVKKAQERHPEITDHNEADACALYYYTQANLYTGKL